MLDKYNLNKISQLNVNQIQELVSSIKARVDVKPESKFAIREAKFKKHISENYKNIGRDDIIKMLADLGVKDGDYKNIKRIETYDILQGLISKSNETLPKLPTATSMLYELTDVNVTLPPLKVGSKIWHGFAGLLLRNPYTKSVGELLLKSDVMNTYHRRWATETIDSVIPRLKEAGFKKEEAYMFMFMDSKMYKGANKKFLSSREKQFIKMLTDKKPNPINISKGQIENMYKRYWEKSKEIVQNSKWATKMKLEDFQDYLNQKFMTDYYTRRVNPKVLNALQDSKGPVFLNLLNKNLEIEANKLKREVYKKGQNKGKFKETQAAFDLRKSRIQVRPC